MRRVEVFRMPARNGGKAQPLLKGMIFPEDQVEEIQMQLEPVEGLEKRSTHAMELFREMPHKLNFDFHTS